jgi:glyceraldehyde-3-phosphate dehydrogenase/erythrose-4-phosphate dehydrogenase
VKDNRLSKLEFLQIKRNLEIEIIAMMKKQLHYDNYLLKNDLYLLNHERELEKIEEAIKVEKTSIQTKENQDLQ